MTLIKLFNFSKVELEPLKRTETTGKNQELDWNCQFRNRNWTGGSVTVFELCNCEPASWNWEPSDIYGF